MSGTALASRLAASTARLRARRRNRNQSILFILWQLVWSAGFAVEGMTDGAVACLVFAAVAAMLSFGHHRALAQSWRDAADEVRKASDWNEDDAIDRAVLDMALREARTDLEKR